MDPCRLVTVIRDMFMLPETALLFVSLQWRNPPQQHMVLLISIVGALVCTTPLHIVSSHRDFTGSCQSWSEHATLCSAFCLVPACDFILLAAFVLCIMAALCYEGSLIYSWDSAHHQKAFEHMLNIYTGNSTDEAFTYNHYSSVY